MLTRSWFFLACWGVSFSLHAAPWPQFRGRGAGGVDDSEALPVTWNVESGENLRWQTPIPGLAHASPVVWGGRVYIATAVKPGGEGELKVGLYGDIAPVQEKESYQWRLLALDAATGKIVWNVLGCEAEPKIKRHPKATHCNSTPATDGEHIVAIFGSEGLFCFDQQGQPAWKVDLGPMGAGYFRVPSAEFGFGSSPIIHDGRVIVLCDVLTNSFVAAFNLADGKEVWRTARQDVPTWGTPTVVEAAGRRQVVVNGWHYSGGYDLVTGRNLWRLDGGGDVPVPTPVYARGLIYLTSAHGRFAPLRAVRAEAAGEITPAELGQTNAAIAWAYARKGNYMQTPIVVGDRLFACSDYGALNCFDARTGTNVYSERLGRSGQGFTASPVSDGRHLYFTSELGLVFVVQADDKFSLVATNELHETCLSTPAISEGTLFFRTRGKVIAVATLDRATNAEYAGRVSATRQALEQRAEAQALARHGKPADAEARFRESLSTLRPVLPPDDPALAEALAELAANLLDQGKFTEAEPMAREALTIREQKLMGHWLTFQTKSLLGRSLLGEKRYAEAEPILVSACQGLEEREAAIPAGDEVRIEEAFQDLARLFQASGQPEKASALAQRRQARTAKARFNAPDALAADSTGDLYVAESKNNVIRKITPAGEVTTLAGSAQVDAAGNVVAGTADGVRTAARFSGPAGVVVDSMGNVYVADQVNNTIRKVTPEGVVSTVAGAARLMGNKDGTGSVAGFRFPGGLAADRAGNLYVADQGNNTIRRVAPQGTNWVVTTLAGLAEHWGSEDATGVAARFNYPAGLAVDNGGNVYVADYGNCAIRKITPAGVVTTLAGQAGTSGAADGTAGAARFSLPSGVAADRWGNLYVTDSGNHTIRKITASGAVTTLAGVTGSAGSSDGTGP
jgi:hypothetical protein